MKTFSAIVFILLIIFVSGCASIPKAPPQREISLPEAEKIISDMETQGEIVRSFYSLGVVTIKGWLIDSDADILIVGIKDPFTMKIELSTWGKPLLHILIKNNTLEVISFQEKTIYQGAFTPEALSRFLPGLNMDQQMIWTILSSRPPILGYEAINVPGPGRVSLMDANGREVEKIFLPVIKYLPAKVSFPEQSLDVYFSDISEDNGIFYAGEMALKGLKNGKDLVLKISNLSINPTLPDQIFTIERFSNYKIVNIDDIQAEPVK